MVASAEKGREKRLSVEQTAVPRKAINALPEIVLVRRTKNRNFIVIDEPSLERRRRGIFREDCEKKAAP